MPRSVPPKPKTQAEDAQGSESASDDGAATAKQRGPRAGTSMGLGSGGAASKSQGAQKPIVAPAPGAAASRGPTPRTTEPMMKAVKAPADPAPAPTPARGGKGPRPRTALGIAPPPPMAPPTAMKNLPRTGTPVNPVAQPRPLTPTADSTEEESTDESTEKPSPKR